MTRANVRPRSKLVFLLVAAASMNVPAIGAHRAPIAGPPLKLAHRFTLPPSVKGHFDHFAVDPASSRVFLTAVDQHVVIVFDLNRGKIVAQLPVPEPRGVVVRSDIGRLFVSDGSGALRVFDLKALKLLRTLKTQIDADPVAFDPQTNRLFMANGGEKAKHSYSDISVFDTTTAAPVGNIQIPGVEIEGMAVEKNGSRLFINNRDRNVVDIVDRNTLKTVAEWPIKKVKRNTVAALDEESRRMFIAGHQGQLDIVDTDTGAELQTLPIGDGADDIAFDPATRLIYIASGAGQGSVDVYEELGPDRYRLRGRVRTGPGAATARLSKDLKKYIVAVPARSGFAPEVLVFDVSRHEHKLTRKKTWNDSHHF